MTTPSRLLDRVKEAAKDYLLLTDHVLLEIPLAVFLANRLPADPLWLFITGPPSNAKTEILNAMNGNEHTETVSSLTKNTLLSGSKIKGKKGKEADPSLLPKLNNKLLIIKDFTTILTMRDESKAEILSQLREVYDGKYSKAYGTGEIRSWNGKIGLIAAVTPIIDRHMSVNQLLGERFLHYRTMTGDPYLIARRAMDNALHVKKLRESFHKVVGDFMGEVSNIKKIKLSPNPEIEDKIGALAIFCAHARTGVIRNRYDQTLEILPEAEGPARIAQQLLLLAIALSLIYGAQTLTAHSYAVVKKVAQDSIPRLRLTVLNTLWSNCSEGRFRSTKDIGLEANIPTTTAKLKLENLHLLGLVDRDREGSAETAPYVWAPSAFLEKLVGITNVLP